MLSSECSFIGYQFQQEFHLPSLPAQTVHLEARAMGHNMLTLNSAWSVAVISAFFGESSGPMRSEFFPSPLTTLQKCALMYRILLLLSLLLSLNSPSHASQTCAATISALRVMLGDPAFPLKWEETTMRDGKPLSVSILEKNETLFLKFIKTGEGLWAESVGVICKTGADLEIRFTGEQIRLGPAANWMLRTALGNGGKFTLTRLGPEQLRIATSGWDGTFSPQKK